MQRRELDSRLLIMVTLALVAFGLVMVYSATSAAAAIGGNDPSYYLKRQGVYAAAGIVLMILAQRWDYRRLRALSPLLVMISLVSLVAVLAIGPPINGARRWVSLGPAAFQPSELAKLSLAIWAASYYAKRKPPRTLRELWRPAGALASVFAVLLVLEPDLGTTIALVIMLVGVLVVCGTPVRVLGAAITLAASAGIAMIWMRPYSRARFFAFLHPARDAAGTGYRSCRPRSGWARVTSSASGSGAACRRSSTCLKRTRT
jgi:cell division protein FtsW